MKYRADIDGLRALAVISVILFHANLALSGGFVGVDIFFVISGYLIGGILVQEIETSTFSMTRFWIRRIRRILPASIVVVALTLVTGLFIFDPVSMEILGKSSLSFALLLANAYFAKEADYFAEASDLNPLLHTWSLAVEEQFYIIFPLLLVLLFRRSRRFAGWSVAGITAGSLALCLLLTPGYPSIAFYLLPTRAWELCAGALLSLGEKHIRLSKPSSTLLAGLGTVAMIGPMFLYDRTTPFPGFAAILPVAGAVAFIAGNRHGDNPVARLFSHRLLIGIGLCSYSLYLYHWPILVFAKHLFITPSPAVTTCALVLTFAFGYLSWRYVETPLRKSKHLGSWRIAFPFAIASSLAIVGGGGYFWKSSGVPQRFDPLTKRIAEDIRPAGLDFESETIEGVPLGLTDESTASYDFVLWGDSHAMPLATLVNTLALKKNLRGRALISSGVAPVTGLWKPMKGDRDDEYSLALNQGRLDWILRHRVPHVILVARWTGMLEGLLPTEIDERAGRTWNYNMVVDSHDLPDLQTSRASFERQFSKMIHHLETHGVAVTVIMQPPSTTRANASRDYYKLHRFPYLNHEDFQNDISLVAFQGSNQRMLDLFHGVPSDVLTVVDVSEAFFTRDKPLHLYDKRSFYMDEDHLTAYGATHFLNPLMADVLNGFRTR